MSTLPNDLSLPDDPKEMRDLLETRWNDIVRYMKGRIVDYTPTIYGSTTAGTVTYTGQNAVYLRQGQMVDYWYAIAWSAWGGGGAGAIRLTLPLKVWNSDSDFWVSSCSAVNVTFSNVGDTVCHAIGVNDTYYADITSSGNNRALGYIPVQAAGTLKGHIRYLGQLDY